MADVKITYDPEAQAIYVDLDEAGGNDVNDSNEIEEDVVVVDRRRDNTVRGVEFLGIEGSVTFSVEPVEKGK